MQVVPLSAAANLPKKQQQTVCLLLQMSTEYTVYPWVEWRRQSSLGDNFKDKKGLAVISFFLKNFKGVSAEEL